MESTYKINDRVRIKTRDELRKFEGKMYTSGMSTVLGYCFGLLRITTVSYTVDTLLNMLWGKTVRVAGFTDNNMVWVEIAPDRVIKVHRKMIDSVLLRKVVDKTSPEERKRRLDRQAAKERKEHNAKVLRNYNIRRRSKK